MQNQIRLPLVYCIAGLLVPTAITYVYFVLLDDSHPWAQKTAYALGKSAQLATLFFALRFWYRRNQLRVCRPGDTAKEARRRCLIWGVASGVVIATAMLVVYRFGLEPLGVMESVESEARDKLENLGAESPWVLVAIALFYSAFHSGFEELYWRGFVFRGLREHVRDGTAVAISSLGFMAHHVLVLGKLFGYDSAMTYLFSLGVAIGGALWAITYLRSNSLIPGWVSHALVDAAIFGIGFWMIYGQ